MFGDLPWNYVLKLDELKHDIIMLLSNAIILLFLQHYCLYSDVVVECGLHQNFSTYLPNNFKIARLVSMTQDV